MHRYEELEKKYYKKKYLNLFFKFILLVIIAVVLYFIYIFQLKEHFNITSKQQKTKLESNISSDINKHSGVIKQKNTHILEKVNKVHKKPYKLVLHPIFPKLNSKPLEDINGNITTVSKQEINKTANIKEIKQEVPKPKINFIVKTETQTLNNLIDLFNQSRTYDGAIKIANIYLNKQNYKKAIEWSKKANELKPQDAKSWYIFAKSLIELGKKKAAKEVLIAYLNTYGKNEKLEQLLRSLK